MITPQPHLRFPAKESRKFNSTVFQVAVVGMLVVVALLTTSTPSRNEPVDTTATDLSKELSMPATHAATTDLAGGGFCWRKVSRYGRGIGRTKRKCASMYGSSNCERRRLLWYQKCKAGYSAPTCCICRTPRAPVPSGWVKCGMGAAVDKATCRSVIKAQIGSVFESIIKVAGMIASAGSSAVLSESSAALVSKASDDAESVIGAFKDPTLALLKAGGQDTADLTKSYEAAKTANDQAQALVNLETATNRAQKARTVLDQVSNFDPTGFTQVAAAYTYPRCSQ